MPQRATLDQRVKWHVAHAKACGCRAIPKTVLLELKRRGGSIKGTPLRRRSR
ncbi:MAG: hypothetical protein ACRENH_16925 [Gemmatimonadaceae bacterium]